MATTREDVQYDNMMLDLMEEYHMEVQELNPNEGDEVPSFKVWLEDRRQRQAKADARARELAVAADDEDVPF